MTKLAAGLLALMLFLISPFIKSASAEPALAAPSLQQQMPSEAEIDELLSKAEEYVNSYRRTFTSAKPSLDKAPSPGFYEKGIELSSEATEIIVAIRKQGASAYRLVSLIAALDDMTINATKAYAVTMLVDSSGKVPGGANRSVMDVVDLAQAGKNCSDISELIFHATLRLISVEEQTLSTLSSQRKK